MESGLSQSNGLRFSMFMLNRRPLTSVLQPRAKSEEPYLEINSKDGYVTVYDQFNSTKNSQVLAGKLCLCSDHKPTTSMTSLPTLNSKTFFKSYKISNILALIIINFYKYTFSYFLGGRCRFYPSCSEYALECFEKFNFIKSSQLVLLRLIKCHPFSGQKGYDPVPFVYEGKKI